MSSPGFRFTDIQHPNEVPGLGGGGGRGRHRYNHANIPRTNTGNTSRWQPDARFPEQRERARERRGQNIKAQVFVFNCALFKMQSLIWVGSNGA